ncbi:hypothetical protein AVEN_184346-1 [Araneus ventricosus]|uniref:Uncharacterized protein n=1 Tax=Araneus ventricosus TaxID=182803 RepID=A0A4Y2NEY9_ARAVE|nr:hypothetical protein AVEN_184346-1 [Araneus ventricosus]
MCQNRNALLKVSSLKRDAPLVGGNEERAALILIDDLRNAAYLRLFKLCSSAAALYQEHLLTGLAQGSLLDAGQKQGRSRERNGNQVHAGEAGDRPHGHHGWQTHRPGE